MKSKVILFRNCSPNVKTHLSTILIIYSRDHFGKSLCFPIFHQMTYNCNFQFIIDNLNNKLEVSKTNFLNMSGRTTLDKSSPNSIPTYIIQYISIPSKILNLCDGTQRNFAWGSTSEKKKMHLINWSTITLPKKEGGLGIQRAIIKNESMITSMAWRYNQHQTKLWAMVIRSRYTNSNGSFERATSNTWKSLQLGWKH